MNEQFRPVRYGVLIALISLAFGIGWAFYMALNAPHMKNDLIQAVATETADAAAVADIAIKRLGMGHSHAMTLALLAIVLSYVVSNTSAPAKLKSAGSVLPAIGSVLFPLAWIIMGLMTPSKGPDPAHEMVTPIAGISVLCILSGIIISAFSLIRDLGKKG